MYIGTCASIVVHCAHAAIQLMLLSQSRNRMVLMTVTAYCALSFSAIGFDELYSLWTSTPVNHGRGEGVECRGMGMGWRCARVPI